MEVCWRINGCTAHLSAGDWAAQIDLNDRQPGLSDWTVDGQAFAPGARLLSVPIADHIEAGTAASDFYVRGTDLIATFGDGPDTPLRIQIYWRAVTRLYPGTMAAIELVASWQTSLLDTEPQRAVSSWLPFPASRSASVGGEYFRFQSADGPADYIEMVHPADSSDSVVEAATPVRSTIGPGCVRLTHALHQQHLEKGVILRSRLLGLWLPATTTDATIRDYQRRFAAEPLPLTT